MTPPGRDDRDAARVADVMAGLEAVGWTDGTIRTALLNLLKDTRARAADRAVGYAARNPTCATRRQIAKVLAALILEDA